MLLGISGNFGYSITASKRAFMQCGDTSLTYRFAVKSGPNEAPYDLLFLFSMFYNWCAVLVDLACSIVLTIGLYRQRTGYDTRTDGVLNQVIYSP